MRVNQHREHTESFVLLDKAHASHIRGEIVNLACALGRSFAIFPEVQIQGKVLHIPEALIPLMLRLDINRPNALAALFAKLSNQVSPQETSCTGNYDQSRFHWISASLNTSINSLPQLLLQ